MSVNPNWISLNSPQPSLTLLFHGLYKSIPVHHGEHRRQIYAGRAVDLAPSEFDGVYSFDGAVVLTDVASDLIQRIELIQGWIDFANTSSVIKSI